MFSAIAVRVEQTGAGLRVVTGDGDVFHADKVLVANGAYANSFELLPRKLALRVKTEFTILAEVSTVAAVRLAEMPTVIDMGAYEQLEYIYLLPPIVYPDGKIYVKLGANTAADRTLPDADAMHAWMGHGDSDVMLPALRRAVERLIPGLRVVSWHTRRCLVTYTPHGYPMIDVILPDRLYVCSGGNGSGAKSSDAIGRLAAALVVNGKWEDEELAAGVFTAVYA